IIGVGNTLGAFLNSFLFLKITNSENPLNNSKDLFKFLLFCTIPGSTLSAFSGVSSLLVWGFVAPETYWNVWITWFSGEMQGFIVVAPFLMSLLSIEFSKIRFKIFLEAIGIFLLVLIAARIAFHSLKYPISFLPFPFLIYATFRFKKIGATTSIVLLSGIAVYRTIKGMGPFAIYANDSLSLNDSLIFLNTFIAAITLMTYLISTVLTERERAQNNALENFTMLEKLKDAVNYELERKVYERTQIIERQKEELERQIEMAQSIQLSLLPKNIPILPEVKIAYKYQPMMKIGGDFFDIKYTPSKNSLGLFICDVSGHGVPAAFIASMVKMSLSNWYENTAKVTEAMDCIYENLQDKLGANFITASILDLNLTTGEMKLARAGHLPFIVIKSNGSVKTLLPKGRIILSFLNPECEEMTDYLEKGDLLILFTDGITEIRSPETGKMFSEERFMTILSEQRNEDISVLCDSIFEIVTQFSGGLEILEDDLTLLILKF
ncbi:MAG: SpoIIE family protein phosphatase, partial [Leptospiraceae bacterium]|nr:SpoIIE family protein phosphatase [Leptospiraceae bacterium]